METVDVYKRQIFLFALWAGLGSKSASHLGGRAIWLSCCFLLVSFTLMFIREELEESTSVAIQSIFQLLTVLARYFHFLINEILL